MLDNYFAVGIIADGEVVHIPRLGIALSRSNALNLATWIITLADPLGEDSAKLMKEAKGD